MKALALLPLLLLAGCTQWQAGAAALDQTAIKLDDQVRADQIAFAHQLKCRLPVYAVQQACVTDRNWCAAFALECGPIESGATIGTAPVSIPLITLAPTATR